MALTTQAGAEKLYKLLCSGHPKASAPEKPKRQTTVKKHSIIGIASETELRERVRMAADLKAHIEKKTARRHSQNYKGPRTVICPCGISFEVPRHFPDGSKKYHSDACRAKYRTRKWNFTPEMDEAIRDTYRNQVRRSRSQIVKPLAEKLGLPPYVVSRRALMLGLIPSVTPLSYPKTRSWTEAEKQIVAKYAGASLPHIGRRLTEAGFHRSLNAIKIFIARNIGPKPKEDYSARTLATQMGIDGHAVVRWIREGWLKATPAGSARTALQGGDVYVVRPEDVREFIVGHLAMIDLRKVDKFWFVELLTGRELPLNL